MAQAFQRLMHTVCCGLKFVFVYLGDILIARKTKAEHLLHLRELFARLEQHGLVVNSKKCQFGKQEFNFLGHRINKNGALPRPEKVDAINLFPKPSTVRDLNQFLGMVNFYHRFMPNAAEVMEPLFTATSGNSKPNESLEWTNELSNVFARNKNLLTHATALNYPVSDAPISLTHYHWTLLMWQQVRSWNSKSMALDNLLRPSVNNFGNQNENTRFSPGTLSDVFDHQTFPLLPLRPITNH